MSDTTKEVTAEQARAAYETLKAFGLQSYLPEYRADVPEGQVIASAVAKVAEWDFDVCMEAAGGLCEEVNMHDTAAQVRGDFARYNAQFEDENFIPAVTVMVPAEEVTR
jgi:hypothetical protein